MMHADHVKRTWLKLRKKELIQQKMDAIRESRRQLLEMIDENLLWIAQFGWREELDENGRSYWFNESTGLTLATMPQYTQLHWFKACRIQWTTRRWLETVYERKRQRELARLAAMALHEKMMVAEFGRTQKKITVRLGIVKRLVDAIIHPDPRQEKKILEELSPEGALPFHLQFMETDVLKPQEWVLLKMETEPPMYKVALVLKLQKTKMKYDVRLVNGLTAKGIAPARLIKMNYFKGLKVEARHKGGTSFYRGVIYGIQKSFVDGEYQYSIKYDDGEKEVRVPRNFIRPSPKGLSEFFAEREYQLKFNLKREQRALFYSAMRKDRLAKTAKIAAVFFCCGFFYSREITPPPPLCLRIGV
jgi:hypothetical protein